MPPACVPACRFITVEGIDGAGKSTHVTAIVERLRAQGFEVVQTREPGGTALAEALRELILHRPMDALTETLLIFAARRDHLREVIEPALARGAVVVCDRFTDATFAYQGAGRGFDKAVLGQLEAWVQEGRQPDLTLWFDLPAEVAAQRLTHARLPDRFEQEPQRFFERVADGYRERARAHPQRFVVIDANAAVPAVRAQVEAALAARGL
ncbi:MULTISPECIES: dTMP kinase [Caldimonas]|uniref:dTMP kinase n=1 Tax=Caldimonas TaxID=196013 RepID=UPI00037D6378|nr:MULTISPECIES: dTMP kinase [Caldimonas]MCX7659052.1 dTMP kinase [Caldimonas manganoxidans]